MQVPIGWCSSVSAVGNSGGLAAGFLAGMHKLDADDMYEDAVWWEAEEEGDAHDMRADVL